MTERDQSRWRIVGVLFVTLFLIWGPVNAGGVFFLPVVKSFGWSRAHFALLGGLAAIAAGVSGPSIGWLIDRAGVRTMMISGAAAVVLCNLALSREFVRAVRSDLYRVRRGDNRHHRHSVLHPLPFVRC